MLSNYLYCGLIFFISVLVQINVAVPRLSLPQADQSLEDAALPTDFLRFMKSLEPSNNEITTSHMKSPGKHNYDVNENEDTSPLTSSTRIRKEQAILNKNNQKETFKDVLMLKLVSYYEDKYRISPHEPTMPTARDIVSNLYEEESTPSRYYRPIRDQTMYDMPHRTQPQLATRRRIMPQRRITAPPEQAIAEVVAI